MEKQKKYTLESVYQLRKLSKSDAQVKLYYNKEIFKTKDLFVVDCAFDLLPKHLEEQMLNTSSDFEAGNVLYTHLKFLTPRQASDRGFWTYLAHHNLYQYVHKRWPNIEHPKKGTSTSYIQAHWILDKNSQHSLMGHALSSLWWAIHISIDAQRQDPLEIARVFMSKNIIYTRDLGPLNLARHKEALIGIMEFVIENNLNKIYLVNSLKAIIAYLNLLGGTKPLAYFDRNWFKGKLHKKFAKEIEKLGYIEYHKSIELAFED